MIFIYGSVALFLGVAYFWSKSMQEEVRILSHASNKVWNQCQHSKVFAKGYRTPSWLGVGTAFFSGSWHTLMHNIVRHVATYPTVKYNRELFVLSDGGTVALDWAVSSEYKDEKYTALENDDDRIPIVFMHHGLCGSSESHYIQSMVHELLHRRKFRVVCLVARGCGGVPLTTPQGFTAARTDDMREALAHLRSTHNAPVFGLGYSLGAGLMAKYVGEEGVKSHLDCACVISPCWDFMHRSPWFNLWSAHFLAKSLVDYTKENLNAFLQCKQIKLDEALKAKYVADYDAAAIVPLHGYRDVDHYYQSCSPITHAHNIVVPTLAISSDDDPVCSVNGCPEDTNLFGHGLVVVRTKRGGHVSWAEGVAGYGSWMDRAILTWLDACHESHRLKVVEQVAEGLQQPLPHVSNDNVASKQSVNHGAKALEKNNFMKDSPVPPAPTVNIYNSMKETISFTKLAAASTVGVGVYKLLQRRVR